MTSTSCGSRPGRVDVTFSSHDSPVKAISPDQAEQLMAVHLGLEPDRGPSDRGVLAQLSRRISAILSTSVVFIVKRDRVWRVEGQVPSDEPPPSTAGLEPALDRLTGTSPPVTAERWGERQEAWTFVGCAGRPPLALAIQGDWVRSSSTLLVLAAHVSLVWQTYRTRARARSRLAAYRLARRLSRCAGFHAVYDAIVRAMALGVEAEIAALAVPDPADGRLSIVATLGYPLELVEHLKIEPRAGVFGTVFHSGHVLHVRDLDDLPEARRRRPRYRTNSFVAMPILGAKEVLGVICVTDRRDNEPFSAEDVSTLRALAAPSALALGRERALVQAENYALTAAIDPVSGAFNRRHFHVRLEEELQRARRHNLSLAFLMVDIDSFKSINDSYGHLAGDTVIKDVAEILRKSVRLFDICARFGGEEFAIIMPGSAVENAALVAERIRERIASYASSDPALAGLHLTASIGLAVSSGGMSGRELIAQADHALYLAKRSGKNRVSVAEPDEKISDARTEPPGQS